LPADFNFIIAILADLVKISYSNKKTLILAESYFILLLDKSEALKILNKYKTVTLRCEGEA